MKTNYQNLTAFETAAVGMVVLGLALIGFQVWVVTPEQTRTDIVNALQVLDMHEAWEAQQAINGYVLGGMEAFLQESSVALRDVMRPVGQDMARTASAARLAFESFTALSDTLAMNYQVNYASSGVETGMGGKVLGAYLEKLSEQVVPAQK